MSKKNLIIIARTSQVKDMEFYNVILKNDSYLLQKAVVLMFPNVEQFDHFLQTVPDDYEFALLVHAGYQSMNSTSDGKEIAAELGELPYADRLKFEYTTREGDKTFEGRMAYYAQRLGRPNFDITTLKYNKAGDLKTIRLGSSSRIDFGILTALDDHEFESFELQLDESTLQTLDRNTIKGQFKSNASYAQDYKGPFILAKQRQMGMVDAALSASEILYNYHPEMVIMGGVCGGRKSKVKMFDVIIPPKVYDYSFGELENGQFKPRDLDAKLDESLINFLARPNNKQRIKAAMHMLLDGNNREYSKYISNVELHFGVMACGPRVVKSDEFLETLSREVNDSIRGLEMESYSIARVHEFYGHKINTLIVKSVMDFTDGQKADELEGVNVKKIAGLTSYLAIRAMLPIIKEYQQTLPAGSLH